MGGALDAFNAGLHSPLVTENLEKMRFIFDRQGVAEHKTWSPTGDWYVDMFGAWNAAWEGHTSNLNATHSEIQIRGGSCVYQTVPQMMPELAPLYPFFEAVDATNFEGTPLSAYMREYYWMPVLAVTLYVIVIFGGRTIMSMMRPFGLDWPLFLWNLGLSAFSWLGVIRIVPHLLLTIKTKGVYFSMCHEVCGTFGAGEAGLWAWLFIISKFPELVDTVFIVLRKKPLIFLHWYHHVTVLLYCWQSYTQQNSAGIYFIGMNFSVHAIMYGYYALKAINMWPRFIPSWIITILQLSQMVVGVIVCVMTYKYEHIEGKDCSVSYVSSTSGALMYFSYFLLFLQILVQLLTKGIPKKKKKTE